MERRKFIKAASVAAVASSLPMMQSLAGTTPGKKAKKEPELSDREYLANLAYKIAAPVLSNMAKGELALKMEVELSPTWDGRDKRVTYMECFGRLMSGIAPWLALPDDDTKEGAMRKELRQWALESYKHSVNPDSPDYLLWRKEGQPLVDSAYFSNALIRAPKQLWEPLDDTTKQRIINELKLLRRVQPPYTNWLLFASMNEAFLMMVGEQYDPMRMDLTLKKLKEWYVGDGWYGDGESFHFDYYNSYVMHPMMVEICEVMLAHNRLSKESYEQAAKRMIRFAEHLERLVSPEGTFPPFGRSLTYRTGAFQPLALAALRDTLPAKLTRGQVRAALIAVHKTIFSNPTNFNDSGFLTLGFCGHQPTLADVYSNNGSMYLTSESLLPLGLPADHPFWTDPAEEWTSKKAFKNEPFNKDYAVNY